MISKLKQTSRASFLMLVLVFLTGLLLRVEYLRLSEGEILIIRDAKQYVDYGRNLINYGVFSLNTTASLPQPDSFRSPGYPMLIAMAMRFGGETNFLTYLIFTQALLSALLAPLAFLTGLFFLPTIGALAAALLVAVCPHLITLAGCVLSETLFAFLLLAGACCLLYAHKTASALIAGISGLFFGCALLTNEAALFLPLILFVFGLWSSVISGAEPSDKKTFRASAIFIVIAMLFPITWAARNHLNVSAEAPKGRDRAIATMSHGAYPEFIYKSPVYRRFPYREDPYQPEFGSSLEKFSEILYSRAKEEPLRYLRWYLTGKPYNLWGWDIIQGVGDIYINPVKVSLFKTSAFAVSIRLAMKVLHPFMLFLALLSVPAVFNKIRRGVTMDSIFCRLPLLPLVICIYFTLIYTVFAPWPRYGIPLRPELYLCSVWGFSFFLRLFIKKCWNGEVNA